MARSFSPPTKAVYIGADHTVTFTFCLQQGRGPYIGVVETLSIAWNYKKHWTSTQQASCNQALESV
ncbi:MAG TPA: hypothetical protein VIY29_27620, partial [Ktedonobacteraceae bacterium]